MKNKAIAGGSIFLLILMLPHFLAAQQFSLIALDIEPGVSILAGKQVKNIYGPGLKFSAGPKINLTEKLWLRVHGGMQWHFKEIEEENSITDHLRTWKAGSQLQYIIVEKKLKISGFGGLNYNWSAQYFSASYNYNPFTNSSQTVTSNKFLKGNGVSGELGAGFAINNISLKLGYEYYQPELTVDPEIVKSAFEEGIIVPVSYRYNFSSLNITIGYELNLSR